MLWQHVSILFRERAPSDVCRQPQNAGRNMGTSGRTFREIRTELDHRSQMSWFWSTLKYNTMRLILTCSVFWKCSVNRLQMPEKAHIGIATEPSFGEDPDKCGHTTSPKSRAFVGLFVVYAAKLLSALTVGLGIPKPPQKKGLRAFRSCGVARGTPFMACSLGRGQARARRKRHRVS